MKYISVESKNYRIQRVGKNTDYMKFNGESKHSCMISWQAYNMCCCEIQNLPITREQIFTGHCKQYSKNGRGSEELGLEEPQKNS